jgi:hypothetical protein
MQRRIRETEQGKKDELMRSKNFDVFFIDRGVSPTQQPNPSYPNGIKIDLTKGQKGCRTEVPYPSPRCGYLHVECRDCGSNALVTVAGRQDDPRSVKIPCKREANHGRK